jgi:hypothetical protein
MGNSGGLSNEQARGLVLEEADGDYDLLAPSSLGGNFGDGGDPYPGTEGNRSFGPTTIPRNQTNGGVLSPVVIDAITYGASTSSASFTGGMPAPVIAAVSPDTIDKRLDGTATFDIRGSGIRYGANVYLSLGIDTVVAQEMTWLGEERVIATFAVEELYAGEWDMFVVAADGQTQAEPKTIDIISVYLATRVSLAQDNLRIHWTLNTTDGVRGCRLYRSADGGAYTAITPDTLRSASGEFEFVDTSTRPGVSYAYKIVTYLNGGREEVFAFRDSFGSGPIHVLQNYPNPFSEKTLVGMSVPVAQRVRIDIYDVSGRLVAHLAEREFDRGTQTVSWNPRDHGARAGVYFCVFRAAGVTKGIKMIYLP